MSRSITVKFIDFWKDFDIYNNKFIRALETQRKVYVLPEEAVEKPDLVFYSRCGVGKHYFYDDCIKIYYTGENDYPNFNECDYAISFHDTNNCGKRNLRYPLFLLDQYTLPGEKYRHLPVADLLNRDFCSVVISNASNRDPECLKIIDSVAAYKPLAYGGKLRNNVGGRVNDKLEFISRYKFNLALENSIMDGYVTEKIIDPINARTVPIYFGGDKVREDFNPDSFINVLDFDSKESLINEIRRIDSDPQLYLAMLNAPQRLADKTADYDSRLSEFLNRIADNPRIFRPQYGEIGLYSMRNCIVHPLSQRRIFLRLSRIAGKFLQPAYFARLSRALKD